MVQNGSRSDAAPVSCIQQYDNPFRYLVPSDDDAEHPYLVELGNTDFPHGRCACADYQMRIEPFISRGLEPEVRNEDGSPRYDCKHIRRLISYLARQLDEKRPARFQADRPKRRKRS